MRPKVLFDPEVDEVCSLVTSGGELEAIGARRETRCADVENIPAARPLRAVETEVVVGVGAARRLNRPRRTRDIGDPVGMHDYSR